MNTSILVLNSGSSTMKFAVYDIFNKQIRKQYTGLVDSITTKPMMKIKDHLNHDTIVLEQELSIDAVIDPYELSINKVLQWLEKHNISVVAVGHRVAHGGLKYRQSVVINDIIIDDLLALSHLAPLHQPFNVKGMQIIQEKFPQILQVACFDTSFHTTCNELSQLFAIPKTLTQQGIRRYGFHGLSYEYVVSKFDKYLPHDKVDGKIIVAHLGQGTSMCAIDHKKSLATTLSFSAVDGLPMGTRCGNIDPGVLLHLMSHDNMSLKEVETLLYKQSGLLGVSGGISSDMRVLLASDHEDAKLAVDLFVYKIGAWIGMLTAELGGLDGLVFTAGIGENSPVVRAKICEKARWLGADLDPIANASNASTISSPSSKITMHVIPTDEETTIANSTFNYFSEEK